MRRRMIDPEIWDSALSKNWKPEDFVVMTAAISAADDEGRGRVSMIFRNVSFMISDKKFRKSLQKLEDSIVIYQRIYYFLPKFKNYQTINRPKPSNIPEPNSPENKDLILKSSLQDHAEITPESLLSKVKVREVKLIEVKSKQSDDEKPLPLTFENSSSLTSYRFTPTNYEDDEQLKAIITLMLARFCKITSPEKAEVTRFFNIITKTKGCTRKTAHLITLEQCQNYKDFEENKRNLPYLSKKIEGKISDAIILDRERRAKGLKTQEAVEVKFMIESPTEGDVFSDIQSFSQGIKAPP